MYKEGHDETHHSVLEQRLLSVATGGFLISDTLAVAAARDGDAVRALPHQIDKLVELRHRERDIVLVHNTVALQRLLKCDDVINTACTSA